MGNSLCCANNDEGVVESALPIVQDRGSENEMTTSLSVISMVVSKMEDETMSRVLKAAI